MNNNFDFSLEPGRELSVPKYTGEHKTISIITPSYNSEEYIFQTANCILSQTYPYFEWLIIDDGSKNEESLERLKKVEAMDPRIKVLHKKNEGLSKTRDYGVEHSDKNTELVVFIDDDDLLEKTYLEMAYYTMMTNSEAAWCYCDVVNFQGEKYLWNKLFSSQAMKHQNILVSQAMVRKSAYYEVGGFNMVGNGHFEDWCFWLKLLAKGHYPVHMSYYGFWYRRKLTTGQLQNALKNKKENMKDIKRLSANVSNDIFGIEYPRANYEWNQVNINKRPDIIAPKYKNNGKTNILVIIPWMMVGGADKFNLDLFKLIDKSKYSVTLLTTQPTEYVWRQKFEEVVDNLFDLSTFIDRKDWLNFIEYIIETRNIDIIFNTNSLTGYMMLPYLHNKYPNIPIMDYIHMEEWYNRGGGYSRDSASVTSVIDKTLFCNKASEKIMNEYFGVDKKKVGTVYIGVDTDKFNPENYDKEKLRKKYKVDNNKFVVGLIARIDYQKRPMLLMRVIEETVKRNKIDNLLFVVAGSGPLLSQIKEIAKEKELNDYVKFLGNSKTPDEIYAISDVTLNCSIKEGLALTSYESLSMGVPVVSSDVGGQKELINEDVGVIVDCLQKEEDIHDFNYSKEEINGYVDGIIKIYNNIDEYKDKCRKRILNGFTINNMVENMQKEFDNVLKNHKAEEPDDNENIYLELINQYLLNNTKEYQWLICQYIENVFGIRIGKRKYSYAIENFKNKMWKNPLWRLFVKSPVWKYGKKVIVKKLNQ